MWPQQRTSRSGSGQPTDERLGDAAVLSRNSAKAHEGSPTGGTFSIREESLSKENNPLLPEIAALAT